MPASSDPTTAVPTAPATPAAPTVASASPASPASCAEPAAPGHRLRIVLPADLHARPAGRLATTVGRLKGVTARLEHRGRSAGAASVLALMALGARAGDAVDLIVEGPGAEEAATALARVLAEAE